ncbi:MATE family efflux transporter [Pseudoprimorskyibacter insulae]|uniref:Multidrug-efflux transporter n=1 Tax=Pseudoprimorskyibacter insulae TaxID=1695997 RepID=A0A2R8B022_9RHOB|nr:MATE family efflux transporter [Pseudoprimorskyibacter insulae]SPF81567.1 Multidrug resistance protein MdtK [Pseudoprimorskyibacter insulae]
MTDQTLSPLGHFRALLVLGLPLIGGHLAQFAIGLTDTIMLGWYGVAELAALTLATTWFFVLFLLGSGFAWAVMPMVASFHAEQDQQSVRRATRMGLWLSGFFFCAALPLMLWSRPIFLALGQAPDLAEMAQTYLRIAGLGMLPALGVMVLKSYLAALERTQTIFWITVGAAVLNGVANYILIFGNFGAPELGIRGGALASLMTSLLSFAAVVVYAVRILPEHALFQRFWRADGEMLRRVFQLGWPIGLTNLSEVGLFASSAFMVGWLGTVPLAAHGIALQVATATFMIHLGLSNAATVRAGAALGRRDVAGLTRGAKVASMTSLMIAVVASTAFFAIPEVLIRPFLDPAEPKLDEIMLIGTGLLALAALFQMFDGAQVIALGLLRGVQDTRVPMIMAATAYWVIGLPAGYVLAFVAGLGAKGIWIGLVLGLSAAAVMLLWRFWRHSVPALPR